MENQAKFGVVAAMAIGWFATQGCRFTQVDKTHCNYNQGDAYCAEQFPDGEYPFCESGLTGCVSPQKTLGCVAERPSDECYSPCGGITTIDEDRSCLEDSESSSGQSSESGSSSSGGGSSETETTMGTTGPMPCVGNEDCPDAAAPFCDPVMGDCVACDGTDDPDAACTGLDPAMPLCVAGTCVQCTAAAPEACTGQTPVCDDATNTCVPCTEHDQCGEAACNLFTGACLPADAVVHVGAGQEYATLTAAVMSFAAGAEGTIIVHAGDYNESITVGGGSVLAFLAEDLGPMVEPPRWIRSAGTQPQLTVTDATVLMHGIQVSSNASSMTSGVLVNGGRAWLDRSRTVDNNGGGLMAQNGAELVLRNCFIGGSADDVDAVTIDGATATVVYTTIGGGNGAFGMARALSCTAGSDVTIRNSFLAALDDVPELACARATVSNTASESAIAGEDNVTLGSVQGGWFTDYSTGDFTLAAPPASVTTAAQWQAGDPLVDIEGDARPGIDGLADVAGADVP